MRYLTLLVVLMGCGDSGISASERGRLLAMRPVWIAAAQAERCPRPALRAPVTGDGSARLRALIDNTSPERQCLSRVKELRSELGPCMPNAQCGPQTLATIQPHPDVIESCAPLYSTIEALAHASEACAPTLDMVSPSEDDAVIAMFEVGNAVRLEVAPLAARGQVGRAAERVLDAMRFADDLGRKSTVIGLAVSTVIASRLVDTLEELAIDPRLSADDARAIAHDLDTLLASSPRWDAIERQEQAAVSKLLAARGEEMFPTLAILDAQATGVRRACSGALRDCVEHFDETLVDGGANFKAYVQRLAMRENALAFLRMQIELRLAPASVCFDPSRRRALLQPWADRAVVGDEPEPVVTPPMWERSSDYKPRSVPHVLRCVSATI